MGGETVHFDSDIALMLNNEISLKRNEFNSFDIRFRIWVALDPLL